MIFVRLMVMIIIKVALVININIIIDDSYESRSKNTCRPVQRMPARRFYFALKLCHQYPAKDKYVEKNCSAENTVSLTTRQTCINA